MKKFVAVLFRTILVFIIVFAGCWYAFAQNGPFNDKAKAFAKEQGLEEQLQWLIGEDEEAEDVSSDSTNDNAQEEQVVAEVQEEEINPNTSIVFTVDQALHRNDHH